VHHLTFRIFFFHEKQSQLLIPEGLIFCFSPATGQPCGDFDAIPQAQDNARGARDPEKCMPF
jgi:hypothetical protein